MAFNPNEHMMNLKGKDYLQVMWRLVWFREDHPDWSIDANILECDAEHAVFKAVICDETGTQKCSGHGSESKRDFNDFIEKAETKAVGRALAMLGYGTQFAADELDEGERIVDSPVKRINNEDAPQTKEEVRKEIEKAKANPLNIDPNKPAPGQIKYMLEHFGPNELTRYRSTYGENLEGMTREQAMQMVTFLQKREERKAAAMA